MSKSILKFINFITWVAVVFLMVLALHILLIGTLTVYYLMHPYYMPHR